MGIASETPVASCEALISTEHQRETPGEYAYHTWVDPPQCVCGALRLGPSTIKRVIELEERLAHGIGERNTSGVDERDRAYTPALDVMILEAD